MPSGGGYSIKANRRKKHIMFARLPTRNQISTPTMAALTLTRLAVEKHAGRSTVPPGCSDIFDTPCSGTGLARLYEWPGPAQ